MHTVEASQKGTFRRTTKHNALSSMILSVDTFTPLASRLLLPSRLEMPNTSYRTYIGKRAPTGEYVDSGAVDNNDDYR